MKVFVSWSGTQSRKVGEVIAEWIPSVIQAAKPYFTPSDIEKGTRWNTEISKELDASQIGILCVTRENIHSDWILFEAGALSKSLEKSHVCPILFGIKNADIAGPLKQFQSTEFEHDDFRKLLTTINSKLAEGKLDTKTLDRVFEKWWPDLQDKISNILAEDVKEHEPVRNDREIIEEILQLTRLTARSAHTAFRVSPKAIEELVEKFVRLHDSQIVREGGYEDTLSGMKEMMRPLDHIARRALSNNEQHDAIVGKLEALSFEVLSQTAHIAASGDFDEDIPF